MDVWQPEAISRFEEVTHGTSILAYVILKVKTKTIYSKKVAQWEKMHARIVTTKERKYGELVRREASPVPGVELFDAIDGNEFELIYQKQV